MTDLLALTDWATLLGLLALAVAAGAYVSLLRQPAGSELMQDVSAQIRAGARAFLGRVHVLIAAVVLLTGLLLLWMLEMEVAVAFVTGAVGSALAGFAATEA